MKGYIASRERQLYMSGQGPRTGQAMGIMCYMVRHMQKAVSLRSSPNSERIQLARWHLGGSRQHNSWHGKLQKKKPPRDTGNLNGEARAKGEAHRPLIARCGTIHP